MSDLVERLRDRSDRYLPDWARETMDDAKTAIETLTREKSALEAERATFLRTAEELKTAFLNELARAEAAESALREALDVVIPFADGTVVSAKWAPEFSTARAFIEKHATAATSEDK